MPDAESFLKEDPRFIMFIIGSAGAGKTDLGMSFEKVFVISCDPAGLEFLKVKSPRNEKLAKNLVHVEPFDSEVLTELKDYFDHSKKSDPRNIFGILEKAKEMAKKGEIKTILLDGFTYLVQQKWAAINAFEIARTKTGEIDKFKMYNQLSIFLNEFVRGYLFTMATRLGLNVVVTCHLKREGEEAMAKKATKDSDLAPLIEGSFRDLVAGLPTSVIYLEHKLGVGGKLERWAYCQKTQAMGSIVNAKNGFGLPAKLDITDKDFFQILKDHASGKTKTAS